MRLKTPLVCLAILLSTAATLQAQVSLDAARRLYTAAEYADALSMLDTLLAGSPSAKERQSVELYRTLCLVAVNRHADAHRSVERMIADDPLYRPSGDDVPPRVRAAFTEARTRMLPTLIQQRYTSAKAAFDRQDYAAAGAGFRYVLQALADPDMAGSASQSPMSDIKILAAGFSELAERAVTPPPVAAAPAPPAPPSPASTSTVVRLAPQRVYGADDADVRPAATINQAIPRFPGTVTARASGVIEVIIDETGAVESAAMIVSLGDQYDTAVLGAARNWRYRPATMKGVPVKFRKRIEVRLSPRS